MLCDCGADEVSEFRHELTPRHRGENRSAAGLCTSSLRAIETTGVVVECSERAALRACVSPRQRVMLVSADPQYLLALDRDDDAAHRITDPTERDHIFDTHQHIVTQDTRESDDMDPCTSLASLCASDISGPRRHADRDNRWIDRL